MKWSVQKGAAEFGVSRDTLRRRLADAGLDTGVGRKFSTLQIHEALRGVGDMDAAKFRELDERGRLLELERREKERELLPADFIIARIATVHQAFRARLMAFPATVGTLANPSDPVMGVEAVRRGIDSLLPILRDDIMTAFSEDAADPTPDDDSSD